MRIESVLRNRTITMEGRLLLVSIAAIFALVGGVPQEENIPEMSIEAFSAMRPVDSDRLCYMNRKPQYPSRSGGPDEYVVRDCTERALQNAVAAMNVDRRGTLFINCGPGETTINIRSTLTLARLGTYRIVSERGRVILNGRRSTRILKMGGSGRLEVYNLSFFYGLGREEGGGAIDAEWRTIVRILDCEFFGNRAVSTRAIGGGGAIYNGGGGVYIWNSKFGENSAPTGGAVQVTSGNLRVMNSIFKRNFASGGSNGRQLDTGFAGALRCDRLNGEEPMPVRICGCEFEENTVKNGNPDARNHGGAVEVWGHADHLPGKNRQMAQILRSRFYRNGVSGEVPNIVMLHGSGNVMIRRTEFIENRSTKQTVRTGSPSAKGKYTTTMWDVTFKNNKELDGNLRIDADCALEGVIQDGNPIRC